MSEPTNGPGASTEANAAAILASEAEDSFASLVQPSSRNTGVPRGAFIRRESYDFQNDLSYHHTTYEKVIHPGEAYGIDPFTGNLLDGTEDLMISPQVLEILQKEMTDDRASSVAINIEESFGNNLQNQETRIALSWVDVSYTIKTGRKKVEKRPNGEPPIDLTPKRNILEGINGQVRPGETVAIIGSSGAGKTTLLNILAGRVTEGEIGGKILVNGQKRTKIWKKLVAYVEQEDIMMRNLTVRETLRNVALLRLPRTMTNEEKILKSEQIMETLGISGAADTMVGDSTMQGVSGGERKRTAIAMQLITSPRLLFLDEPTSGLDAYTAYSIIETITQVAKNKAKTVVMTIHQPREDILFLFDKILLLAHGRTIFFGPVQVALDYFQSIGFECPRYVNPADFFMDTISLDLTDELTREKSQEKIDRLKNAWKIVESQEKARRLAINRPSLIDVAEMAYVQGAIQEQHKDFIRQNRKSLWQEEDKRNYWHVELFILLRRCFTDFSREMIVSIGLSIQTIILFLLVSFTFFQLPLTQPGIKARVGILFLYVSNLTFATVFPLLTLFPLEKRVIISDRFSTTYRMSSYYLAKAISVFPFRLFLALILVMGSYYIVGLNPLASRYFTAMLITMLVIFTAQALGLFLGAIAPNVEIAQIVGPLIVTIFFVYGGNFANLSIVPAVLAWIQWLSLLRYAYMSFFQNEFDGLTFLCFNNEPPINGQCIPGFATGEQVIAFYDQDVLSIVASLFILFGFGIFFHIATYIALRIVTKPKMNLV